MSAIRSQEISNYIYLSVVLPLKQLNIDSFSCPNPLTDTTTGRETRLYIEEEELDMSGYRHNYQRDRARANRRLLIKMKVGTSRYIIGAYENKRHTVELYKSAFVGKFGRIVLGKLEDMLQANYPFTKVMIVDTNFVPHSSHDVLVAAYNQEYDPDEDEDEDDDDYYDD